MEEPSLPGQSFFALRLTNGELKIENSDAVKAFTPTLRLPPFTIEVWVRPEEDTSLGESDERCVVARFGLWEIGFTGIGLVYAKWIQQEENGNATMHRVLSTIGLASGEWHYISLAIDNTKMTLFSGEREIGRAQLPPGVLYASNGPFAHSDTLKLGGHLFSGLIRTVVASPICKQSVITTPGSEKPANEIRDFQDSMYHASFHSLPPNACAFLNLLHPKGDPDAPQGAVPLCCLLPPIDATGKARMIEVPLPRDKILSLEALSAARVFNFNGFIDCGVGAIRSKTFTIEMWFLMASVHHESEQKYTLFSHGSLNLRKAAGWGAWLDRNRQTGQYELSVGDTEGHGDKWFHADLPAATLKGWCHLVIAVGGCAFRNNSVYLNGRLLSENGPPPIYSESSISNALRSFPLAIGGAVVDTAANGRILSTDKNWHGWIRAFQVWKSHLSPADVASHYRQREETESFDEMHLRVFIVQKQTLTIQIRRPRRANAD